jgi:membrane glycosyltransferase
LTGRVGMFPSASAGVLFLMTLTLLFGPKVLSLLHLFSRPRELEAFGGAMRVIMGSVLETLFSVLTAPVLVWFHTRFVLRNLAGKTVVWNTQTRESGDGPSWNEVVREYWPLPIIGIVLSVLAWWISPNYLLWLSPLLVGLILAIPVAHFSCHTSLFGELFKTPEELHPPKELSGDFRLQLREGDQFVHAVLDPFYNAVHVALQRKGESLSTPSSEYGRSLAMKLFKEGPDALTAQEKRALLTDGHNLAYLHALIWKTPGVMMHPAWSKGLVEYRSAKRGGRHEPEISEAKLTGV